MTAQPALPEPPGDRVATTVHEVRREAVARFAEALGLRHPIYREPAAARAAGHPDVLAPPTFPIVFVVPTAERILAAPELAFDYSRVVHRDQQFTYSRPIHAGDQVTVRMALTSIEAVQGSTVATFEGTLSAGGDLVCTTRTTLVSRAGEGS